MHLKKLQLSLLISMLAVGSIAAQDIHFTQYNMSPLTLNPANTGAFEGTVRLGGIYRSQWTSVLKSNQFETPSAWVDAPIIRGFRKQDWIGAGMMLFQDKVGAGVLVHSAGKLSAAYHLALGKKGTTVIAIGGQYGQESYRIDKAENLQFGLGFVGNNPYNSAVDGENFEGSDNKSKSSFSDINAGVTLSSRLNNTMDFKLGFSMYHVGEPRFSIAAPAGSGSTGGGGNFRLPRRSVLHGTFNIKTSELLTISPSFIFQTINNHDEIMVQALGGYLFNREKDITLNAGLGYRLGDAINILAGARIKNLTLGVAYDVNTSGLNSDTRYRGGFEIAANYVVKIYKKAVVKPKLLCPRF